MTLNEQIMNLRASGATFLQIARSTGLTRSAVAGRCSRMGLTKPATATSGEREVRSRRIVAMALAGHTNATIARSVGTSEATVSLCTSRLGIDRRCKTPKRQVVRVKTTKAVSPTPTAPPAITQPDSSKAVLFIEATGCNFPLWGADERDLSVKSVCGGEVTWGAYCAFHGALAYRGYDARKAA